MITVSYRRDNVECETLRTLHLGLFGFILAAGLRAIPELQAGPNLVGHDTVLYAGLIARTASCFNDVSSISYGNSPLLFLLLCPLGKVTSPLLIMKVAPVALYGLLGSATVYFAVKSLNLPPRDSILVAAFVMIQVAALRISWDLHRNVLSTAVLLFLIANLRPRIDRVHGAFLLLLGGLVIASHELVGALMILIVVLLLLIRWKEFFGRELKPARFVIAVLVVALVWLLVVVSRIQRYENLFVAYGATDVLAVTQLAFFSVLFLPLIPLVLMGKRTNAALSAWIAAAGLIAFSPLLPIPFAPAFWDRWMLMLVFPLGILGGIGVLRVPAIVRRCVPRLYRYGGARVSAAILLAVFIPFVVVSSGFMIAPPNHPFWLFDSPLLWRAGSSGIPSTMQSNTVDFDMTADIQRSLTWLAGRMNSSDVLLTHDAFYGYALIYMPLTTNILWYGYYGVDWGLSKAKALGYKEAYLIWFVPGSGWHSPDPDLTGFKLVHQSGMIMLYVTSLIAK